MFGRLGFGEIVLILIVLLVVFGPRRLPELGSALGKGIREFKRSVSDLQSQIDPTEQAMNNPNSFHRPTAERTAVTAGSVEAPKQQAPAERVEQDA
jgi:TatA/E family protein of Tat protein translocase